MTTEDHKQHYAQLARYALNTHKNKKDVRAAITEFYQRWKKNNGSSKVFYEALQAELENYLGADDEQAALNEQARKKDSIDFTRELGR